MKSLFLIAALVVVWFLLMKHVLPRFGVKT